MKRKILLATGLICMMISFHACDKLGTCQVCSQVKRDATTQAIISQGNEAEYCDAELIAIKATPPVTVGNTSTKYECR